MDGLRGLAVLMVVWVHVFQHIGPERDWLVLTLPFSDAGARGVQLFFLISAFTLYATSLRRFKEDDRPTLFFYIRRFFRIWPFWALVVVLWAVLDRHAPIEGVAAAVFLFGFVRFQERFDVVAGGWTLFVEETFYVFLPLIFRYINNLWRAVGFSFILYVISDIWLTQAPPLWPGINHNNFVPLAPLAQWFAFGLGITLFYLLRDRRFKAYVTENQSMGLLLDGLAIFGFWKLLPSADFRGGTWALVLVFIAAASNATLTGRLMRTHIMRLLGRLCYSAYLLQFLLIVVIEPYRSHIFGLLDLNARSSEVRMLVYFPIFVLLLTGLSYIAYMLIERPSISVGKKLIAKLGNRNASNTRNEKLAESLEGL